MEAAHEGGVSRLECAVTRAPPAGDFRASGLPLEPRRSAILEGAPMILRDISRHENSRGFGAAREAPMAL